MQIGQIFRYSKPFALSPPAIDGLPNFIAVTHTPGARFVLLERGIDRIACVVAQEGGHSRIADFLHHLDRRYDRMIANRNPEEALLI
jgi:hypothetical protein